jgi:O-6-methylguanine DNA methyltransferase
MKILTFTKEEFKKYLEHDKQIFYSIINTRDNLCFIAWVDNAIFKLYFISKYPSNLEINSFLSPFSSQAKLIKTFDMNKDLLLVGTEFQIKVWRALLNVPTATTISYEQLAIDLGVPSAVRAVASAVARNEISYFIPCHRVIHKSGDIGNYRWGASLKKKLLENEKNLPNIAFTELLGTSPRKENIYSHSKLDSY